jgi:nucleoid DNA-binding protein
MGKFNINDQIVKEIAEEKGLDPEVVEKAIRTISDLVTETIEHSTFEDYKNIQIMKFGKFVVKPFRLEYWKKFNERKKTKENE